MAAKQSTTKVYKILTKPEWAAWSSAAPFTGAGIDIKDGYIHLSTDTQVVETYEKFFKDSDDVVLVTVDLEKVKDEVKWEASRHRQLFPHVYGGIDKDAVVDHVEGWAGQKPEA